MRHAGGPWISAAGAVAFVLLAAEARAQRTISWDELAVEARLDADGRLHVKEKQVMALSGDWNGGERLFTPRSGQALELHGITRIDPATGAAMPLTRGALDVVDQYDFTDANALRWRSRSPSDPPYRDTRLTYVLDYTYANVLQPRGGNRYELDHDFAFAQRPGTIRRFTLDLTLDPVWIPRGPLPTGIVAVDLAPGRGYVARLDLDFRGEGVPAGVDVWGPRVAMAASTAFSVLPLLVLANGWWRERRAGRLHALPAASRGWLEENILSVPAEVIGAAWDEKVGAPEVAAVIARLQAEGGLETRVGRAPRVGAPEMTLTLKVPLGDFEGYEHDLLRALFAGGARDETSTQAIRERYKSEASRPLDHPARCGQGRRGIRRSRRPAKPSWLPGTILFWGGAALLFLGGPPQGDLSPVRPLALFGTIFCWLIGHAAASAWRRRVDRGSLAAVPWLLLAVVPLIVAWASLRLAGTPGWRTLTTPARWRSA